MQSDWLCRHSCKNCTMRVRYNNGMEKWLSLSRPRSRFLPHAVVTPCSVGPQHNTRRLPHCGQHVLGYLTGAPLLQGSGLHLIRRCFTPDDWKIILQIKSTNAGVILCFTYLANILEAWVSRSIRKECLSSLQYTILHPYANLYVAQIIFTSSRLYIPALH